MSTGLEISMKILTVLFVLCTCARAREVTVPQHWNASSMLVFGDSTVDPGNNNQLPTSFRANFPPYGKDFFDSRPTGRFCDGRLATDYIAESLGISKSIPAFLDPNLSPRLLKRGVSFASASSGYDVLTAENAGVLSFPKQIEYMMHYKVHLKKLVGAAKAQKIVDHALVVISAGTNDFIQNYFFYTNRSTEFTVPQYEDYLIDRLSEYVKEIHRVGAKRFVLVGIPPMGCVPLVKTLQDSVGCFAKYNDAAMSFNSKLVKRMAIFRKRLGLKVAYLDIYRVFDQVTKNPIKYGFTEVEKGCIGSGTIEMGESCKGQDICDDPRKYMYWDAIHPTQYMYKIVADEAMRDITD